MTARKPLDLTPYRVWDEKSFDKAAFLASCQEAYLSSLGHEIATPISQGVQNALILDKIARNVPPSLHDEVRSDLFQRGILFVMTPMSS